KRGVFEGLSMLRRAFVGLFAALALGACASAPPASDDAGPVEISMTRTPCFGFCPDYTVTITGDGHVIYEGRRFVNVVGRAEAHITPAQVQALLARFDAVGFERLQNEYRAGVTDLPSTTIQLVRNGRSKSVLDYGGTGAGMPESVRELQAEIDRVAGTAPWV